MKRDRFTKLRYRVVVVGMTAFIAACVYLFYMSHLLLDRSAVYMSQDRRGFYHPRCSIQPEPSSDNCSTLAYRVTADLTTHEILWKGNYNLDEDGVSYPLPTFVPVHSSYGADPLTVIVVPHSHNDPGWMKTAEEYFVDNTKHILNRMVEKLSKYNNMTFIWAETVFLSMWWSDIDDHVKSSVRRLIQRGQLEIVSGGWVMPDEASTHYTSLINQLIEGHQWLRQNLRVKPVNSWSIDAFGHSATVAYISKQAGFENMVIQRAHQATKAYLAEIKMLEFNWRQYWDDTGSEDILCHIMPYMLYNVKHSCGPDRYFCLQFDFRNIPGESRESRSEPITDANVKQQATYMYEQFRKKASLYRYDTLLVPLGDDFYFTKDIEWDQQYVNYVKLMTYINAQKHWNTKVKFGTLSDFFVALRRNENHVSSYVARPQKFPKLSGDFFVYSDRKLAYWSGFFSTRPFAKRLSRDLQASLQAAEALIALKQLYRHRTPQTASFLSAVASRLQQSRRLLAIFQHHDAITGTSRDVVAQNFLHKLTSGFAMSQEIVLSMMSSLLKPSSITGNHTVILKPSIERSRSDASVERNVVVVNNGKKFLVFFNPLTVNRLEVIHVELDSDEIVMTDEDGREVFCQVNPIISGDRNNIWLSESRFEVSFLLSIGPLQILRYKVEYTKYNHGYVGYSSLQIKNADHIKVPRNDKIIVTRIVSDDSIKLNNNDFEYEFSGNDGLLMSITDLKFRNKTNVNLNFVKYKSQGSGAYILRIKQDRRPFTEFKPLMRVFKGPLFSEIVTTHEVGVAVVVHKTRVYTCGHQALGVHIENSVDISQLIDAEVIMMVQADFGRITSFFTDENGYQYILRETHEKLTPAGNFYPMTTMAFMEDKHFRVTLHSGQPMAAGILKSGEFEVILDRTMRSDDHRGIGQGVLDNRPTSSYFVLQVEQRIDAIRNLRKEYAFPSLLSSTVNDALQLPVVVSYTSHVTSEGHLNTPGLSVHENERSYVREITDSDLMSSFTAFVRPFPCDISVVTFYNLIDHMMGVKGVAVILHRKVLDCSLPSYGIDCSLTKGILDLTKHFKHLRNKLITKTSLSLLHEIAKVDPRNLKLSRMEMATYKL